MEVYTVVKYKWKESECSSCGTDYHYSVPNIEGLYNSLENAKASVGFKKGQELVWKDCNKEDINQVAYTTIDDFHYIIIHKHELSVSSKKVTKKRNVHVK